MENSFDFLNKGIDYVISSVSKFGYKILICFLIGFFGVKIARYISKKIFSFPLFEKIDPNIKGFAQPSIKLFLYAIVLLTCTNILGIDMTGFVAVLASCGVAIGMAMQGSLSNIAGGVMLLILMFTVLV